MDTGSMKGILDPFPVLNARSRDVVARETATIQAMQSDWLIILTADGAVLAVAGGAPVEWVGKTLVDREDAPDELRQSVRLLLRQLHGSRAPFSRTVLTRSGSAHAIDVLAIEAIPLRRAHTDLHALLESAVGTMRPQATAVDIGLTLQVDESARQTLSLDAEKVAWILTALIGNALRYVRHGSRLLPGGIIAIRASFEPATSEVIISIEDDGPGIPEHVMPYLFRRSTNAPLTAGLGLKIASEIVAAHGGRFDVRSPPGPDTTGTTVQFSLPALS
jgi:signal transduction histidine kinase